MAVTGNSFSAVEYIITWQHSASKQKHIFYKMYGSLAPCCAYFQDQVLQKTNYG